MGMREIATIKVFYEETSDAHLLTIHGRPVLEVSDDLCTDRIIFARSTKAQSKRFAEDFDLVHAWSSAFHEVLTYLVKEEVKRGGIKVRGCRGWWI